MTSAEQMIKDSYIDQSGIVRWRSNDRVPPTDCLMKMGVHGVELIRMEDVREHELNIFLAEYRAAQPAEPTPEERFEMRAAFGIGARIVNVLTGRIIVTA